MLKQAIDLARRAHEGQFRKWAAPGAAPAPFITHPMAVALHVHQLGLGDEATAAAVLHDVLEDTTVAAEEIERTCGATVRKLVEELTNRRQPGEENLLRAERKRLDRERLANISPEAQQIKLCDRIHNVRSIRHAPPQYARKYLAESALLLSVLGGANKRLATELENTIREVEECLNVTQSV